MSETKKMICIWSTHIERAFNELLTPDEVEKICTYLFTNSAPFRAWFIEMAQVYEGFRMLVEGDKQKLQAGENHE